jgi:hypothetical protein
MKKKPKNIPHPYKSKGIPVYRDTTALPFENGGELLAQPYPNSFFASDLGNYYADGGPLHDRDNETGKLLNSTYASALGSMFRDGGYFDRGYSLPEDSFRQGGRGLKDSIYASTSGQYPAPYKYGGSVLSMSNTPQLEGEGKDLNYPSKGYAYVNGGPLTKLNSAEEKAFKKFYNTLPENLQTDDVTYDIRGYWDSEGRPSVFDYSQPKQNDGYYHAYSINSNTGEYLKSPAHQTFQHAVDEDRKIGYRPITNMYGRNIATYNESIASPEEQTFLRNTEGPINFAKGGMLKRADGSYSQRGLWDNIRANKGSGKKPTKAMLAQEKKINANTYDLGGPIYTYAGRPDAQYKKVNNKWFISAPGTNGFIPVNDPSGKRTALLNKQAVVQPRTKNYNPLLQPTAPSETLQNVAKNTMQAENLNQYSQNIDRSIAVKNVKDPGFMYKSMDANQLAQFITPELQSNAEALVKQGMFNSIEDAQRDLLIAKEEQKFATPGQQANAWNNYNDAPVESTDWMWALPLGASAVPAALEGLAGLAGTEILGSGLTAGNAADIYFGAQGVGNLTNAVEAQRQGDTETRNAELLNAGLNLGVPVGLGALSGAREAARQSQRLGLGNVATGKASISDIFKRDDLVNFKTVEDLAAYEKAVAEGTLSPTRNRYYSSLKDNPDAFNYAKGQEQIFVHRVPQTKAAAAGKSLANIKPEGAGLIARQRSIPTIADVDSLIASGKLSGYSDETLQGLREVAANPEGYQNLDIFKSNPELQTLVKDPNLVNPAEHLLPRPAVEDFTLMPIGAIGASRPALIEGKEILNQGLQGMKSSGKVPTTSTLAEDDSTTFKSGGAMNFKSKGAYQKWLAYGHASGEFAKTPGNQKVSIKGKAKKVEHEMGGNLYDNGGKSRIKSAGYKEIKNPNALRLEYSPASYNYSDYINSLGYNVSLTKPNLNRSTAENNRLVVPASLKFYQDYTDNAAAYAKDPSRFELEGEYAREIGVPNAPYEKFTRGIRPKEIGIEGRVGLASKLGDTNAEYGPGGEAFADAILGYSQNRGFYAGAEPGVKVHFNKKDPGKSRGKLHGYVGGSFPFTIQTKAPYSVIRTYAPTVSLEELNSGEVIENYEQRVKGGEGAAGRMGPKVSGQLDYTLGKGPLTGLNIGGRASALFDISTGKSVYAHPERMASQAIVHTDSDTDVRGMNTQPYINAELFASYPIGAAAKKAGAVAKNIGEEVAKSSIFDSFTGITTPGLYLNKPEFDSRIKEGGAPIGYLPGSYPNTNKLFTSPEESMQYYNKPFLPTPTGEMGNTSQFETMQNPSFKYGGSFNNPGFKALPTNVQAKIKANSFADGGPMAQLTEFNAGGTHEQNPIGGIPQGMAPNGQVNLVEQGETKLNSEDYVFSDSLKVDKETVNAFGLSKNLIGKTFADASKTLNRPTSRRENDTIEENAIKRDLDNLMAAQEFYKQEQVDDLLQELQSLAPDLYNQMMQGMQS